MCVLMQLNTVADFWLEMVFPDCNVYFADETNLRRALHAAISLFHMSDWVLHTHEENVRSAFTFTRNGKVQTVSQSEDFATALEQKCDDFGRIRGIANATKHLKLRHNSVRPVSNAPSHAANIAIQTADVGADACRLAGGYGWLMLAGPNGNDMEFSSILRSVYSMWKTLKSTHVDCPCQGYGTFDFQGTEEENDKLATMSQKVIELFILMNGPASKKLWKDKGGIPAFYRDMLTLT